MAIRQPVLTLSRLHLLALGYLSGLLFLQHIFREDITPRFEAFIVLLLAALLLGLGGLTMRFNREWAANERERVRADNELRRHQRELGQAQAFLDTIINHIPSMIYVKDVRTGTYVLCNQANARFLGRPPEAILGKTDAELFPPGLAAAFTEQDRTVLARGRAIDIPCEEVRTPDGPNGYQHTQKILVPGDDGAPRYLLGISENISDRVRAEQALRAGEEQYRTLIGNLSVGIYRNTGDAGGRFISANAALAAMHGYPTVEEFIAVPVIDLYVNPEERRRFVAELRDRGWADHRQLQLRRRDGSWFWAAVTARATFDDRGTIRWIDGVVEDISNRKRDEDELQRHRHHLEELVKERAAELVAVNEQLQKEVLRATLAEEGGRVRVQILDAVTDAVFVHTVEGRILYANEAAWWGRGYTRDELFRRNFNELESPRYRRRQPGRRQLLEANGEVRYDSSHLVKSGSPLAVEVQARLITYADGPAVLSVARDISERKRIEKRMQQVLQELRKSNAELEQFAYIASHDLQEPLRMVTGYVQLLQRRYADRLTGPAAEYIGFAVEGAKRMQQLISDLLTYARISRPAAAPLEPIDSARVLARVLTILGPNVEECGASITGADLPPVLVEESHLTQLLQNLVGNALKFRGTKPPVITVRATPELGFWKFAVADNGIGIAPEFHERIFMIFQRLHTAAEYAGTGIGLAVCRKIVERYGGRIWVESKPGKGATFLFTLPRAAAD